MNRSIIVIAMVVLVIWLLTTQMEKPAMTGSMSNVLPPALRCNHHSRCNC